MANPYDQIGRFLVVRLGPLPPPAMSQLEIAARAGVNGVQLWDTGKRGVPFQVDSLAVVRAIPHAHALARLYTTLIGAGAQQIRYASRVLENRYFVLDVQTEIRALVQGRLARDSINYRAEVRARWTLLAHNS